MRRAGFTLLEVMIALGILVTAMLVLMNAQGSSVLMAVDAQRSTMATMLAEEKMKEIMLNLEHEGWTDQDIDEEGNFEDYGKEDFRGDVVSVDLTEGLEDYRWAYTVRKIELTIPPDMGGMAEQLVGSGYYGSEKTEAMQESDKLQDASGQMDISQFISPEQMSEYLSGYLREVRIRVWWGENEDEDDQVELVHHVVNPTGMVKSTGDENGGAAAGGSGGGGK
jgi:general secretion pathway protein I